MEKIVIEDGVDWDKPLFCVTHADRITQLDRCDLNFLEKRYGDPERLANMPPFSSLTPISMHQPYGGAVTIWSLEDCGTITPRLNAYLRPEYKPQHAIWHKGILWVLGIDRLLLYKPQGKAFQQVGLVEDPWLSGAHTITPDKEGNLLVSCAGSDSILIIDSSSLQVVSALRIPASVYGINYPLTRTDSVVEHFIPNDFQLAHVNCVWPWRDGAVISTLAQGAIGWFDSKGVYRELIRGFVGCHGIRARRDSDALYFSDSCIGIIVLLDEKMQIKNRIRIGSMWMHDALELNERVFAVTCADRNQVEFFDTQTRSVIGSINCKEFGEGPQFLSYGG